MACHRLAANTNYFSIGISENLKLIAKRTGLCCASRAVVFRIKIYHKVFLAKDRIYVEHVPVLIRQCKSRNSASDFDFVYAVF